MKDDKCINPDVILKNYWNDNNQFADFVNTYLYNGQNVVSSDELKELDTDMSSLVEYKDVIDSEKGARDVIKIAKLSNLTGISFIIIGIENQEYIDYAMPLRAYMYDAINYKKQLRTFSKSIKNTKGLTKDEFLSRIRKTDTLTPVYTIVIYYGEKPWDGPKSLHEMFGPSHKDNLSYINDYHLNLLEVRNNNLIFHNKNNIDFFKILKIFFDESLSKKERREKAIQYTQDQNTDDNVILTAARAASINIDYTKLAKNGGNNTMCKLFDEIADEARLEGSIHTYIQTCKEFGISNSELKTRVINKFNISEEDCDKYIMNALK